MWKYVDLASNAARAQQIWMILSGCARNHQTITYENLALEMGLTKGSARFLGSMLGPVYNYCSKNGLPSLTILAVRKCEGTPGKGFTRDGSIAAKRQEVFNYKWYTICIPSRKTFEKVRTGD